MVFSFMRQAGRDADGDFLPEKKRKKNGNGGCFSFCSSLWSWGTQLAIPHSFFFFSFFSTEKDNWVGNKFILGSDGRINGSKSGRKMALLGTNLSFLLILQKK